MLSGITISLLIAVFLGIVGWAYGRERQADFTAAAMLPLQQDSERKPLP
jgi:cbb3-type cytochrome oxidase subunit 3